MAKDSERKPEYFRTDEFIITGRHKDYVDKLWVQNKIQESRFRRLVDLYCVAAIIGFITKRKAEADNSSTDKRTVQIAQILDCYPTLIQIMRIILILDKSRNIDADERVRSAFREPKTREEYEANMELFNSYARGGIEVLYERLVLRVGDGPDDEYDDERVNNIIALLLDPPNDNLL